MRVLILALLPVVLLIGLSCVAATVLGWVAVSQIRRSQGRLRGLGLAVFDGLLFPLLALDVVIGWLVFGGLNILFTSGSPRLSITLVLTLLISAAVDWLIASRVWRAVRMPSSEMEPPDQRSRRSPRLVWAGIVAMLLLLAGAIAASSLIPRLNVGGERRPLANSPQKLRRAATEEVIQAGLAKPDVPWAWHELQNRARDGRLNSNETRRLFETLTAWMQQEHPEGYSQPLHSQGNALEELVQRKLVPETNVLAFLQAYRGKPSFEPLPRLREGERELRFRCNLRSPWHDLFLGFSFLNEVRSVTLDGQPLGVRHLSGKRWNMQDYHAGVPIPDLAPGTHVLRCEVESALVATSYMTGLPDDAPVQDWPPAKLRWIRTCEAEFTVYPEDAELVALTNDPALNPVAAGAVSIRHILIRPQGDVLVAVVPLDVNAKTDLPVSVDVSLRLAGETLECGSRWSETGVERTSSGGTGELKANLDSLDPRVREADVILTPNPEAVESRMGINRIWGEEIVFRNVPLRRLDLGEAEPAEVPAEFAAVHSQTRARGHIVNWVFLLAITTGFLVPVSLLAVGLVLLLRRNKSGGAGLAAAIGCGVVGLGGILVSLLVIGGLVWIRTRTVNRAEATQAQLEAERTAAVRRHEAFPRMIATPEFSSMIEGTVNDDGAGRDFFIDLDTLRTRPAEEDAALQNQIERTRTTLKTLLAAIRIYEVDVGEYPASLDALVKNPGDGKWKGPYAKSAGWPPKDEWGTPLRITVAGTAANSIPVILSAGPDASFGTADDVRSEGF